VRGNGNTAMIAQDVYFQIVGAQGDLKKKNVTGSKMLPKRDTD
jgi:hypothetical protein